MSPSPFAGVMQAVAALLGKVLSTCASDPVQAAAPRQDCDQGSASTGDQLSGAARFLGDISEPALSSLVLLWNIFIFWAWGLLSDQEKFFKVCKKSCQGDGERQEEGASHGNGKRATEKSYVVQRKFLFFCLFQSRFESFFFPCLVYIEKFNLHGNGNFIPNWMKY